jgi:hypothetical protein
MDEQAVNAVSVLLQDNEQLKNQLTFYQNTLIYLKAKHPQIPSEEQDKYAYRLALSLNDAERNALLDASGKLRAYAMRINIQLNSIIALTKNISEESKTKLAEGYKEIEEKHAPGMEKAEQFVQVVNDILNETIDIRMFLNSKNSLERVSSSKLL